MGSLSRLFFFLYANAQNFNSQGDNLTILTKIVILSMNLFLCEIVQRRIEG